MQDLYLKIIKSVYREVLKNTHPDDIQRIKNNYKRMTTAVDLEKIIHDIEADIASILRD